MRRRQRRGCTVNIDGTSEHLLKYVGRQQLKLCTLLVDVVEDHQLAHGHNVAHGYLDRGAPAHGHGHLDRGAPAHHGIIHLGAIGKDHLDRGAEVLASYRAQNRILRSSAHRDSVHHHEGHRAGVLPQDQLW